MAAVRAFFRTVVRSMTDLRFYREARRRRVPDAVGYLAVLLIVSWLVPFSVDFFVGVRRVNDAIVSGLRAYVPPDATFTMKDGKLTSNLERPIVFGHGDFTLIVNSASSSLALSEDETGVVVNQDVIVQHEGAGRVQLVSYTDIPDFETDRSGMERWIAAFGPWLVLLVSTAAILAFSLALALGYGAFVLLHALILYVVMRLLKRRLPFARAFTVAAFAATVPVLLKAIADWNMADIGAAPTYLYWILLGFIAYDFRKEAQDGIQSPSHGEKADRPPEDRGGRGR